MKILAAFGCGAVFAVGLAFSGMLKPEKVIAFLELRDPSLAFVMGPAVAIYAAAAWKRSKNPERPLDLRLFLGAAVFGIGWGLAGVCPGPAIVNLAAPNAFFLAFMAALLAGVALSFAVPKPGGANVLTRSVR